VGNGGNYTKVLKTGAGAAQKSPGSESLVTGSPWQIFFFINKPESLEVPTLKNTVPVPKNCYRYLLWVPV
jgi:hypothetical protein